MFEDVTITNANGGKLGDIGPLASQLQFDKVTGYIRKGIEEGARLVTGGPESKRLNVVVAELPSCKKKSVGSRC